MLKNLEVNKARFDAQMYKADEALADMTISQELSTLTTQVRVTLRDLLSHPPWSMARFNPNPCTVRSRGGHH